MKEFASEVFGNLSQPDTFEELMYLVIGKSGKGDYDVRYWRGQSDIDWRLDSSAYRRMLQSEYDFYYNEKGLKRYELGLLEQADHKGYRFHNGRELFDFELLGRLQHHGAATRLMDFSRNALVALWFCINQNLDRVGLLVGIHTNHVVGKESSRLKGSYESIIDDCNASDNIFTWEPPNVSSRIAAQHSQFLYSKITTDKRGSLVIPEDTLFIAVQPELKVSLKAILEQAFDLWPLTMFPDVDGFGLANAYSVNPNAMSRW
ncbi:MAG: FRG domain-containing protein [Pedobacter sp.]